MDQKKTAFLSLLGIAVLLVSIVLGTPGKGNAAPPPADRDVRVINSASEAVPVSGSLTLAGTPGVVVTNAPDVVVTNSAANPILVRDVDRGAAQPFVRQVQQNILPPSEFSTTSEMTFTVPVGKRLVIETVSFKVESVAPQTVLAGFAAKSGGIFNQYFVPLTTTSFGPLSYHQAVQSVKVYADSDSPVWGAIRLSSGSTGATVWFTVSGYLVDMP